MKLADYSSSYSDVAVHKLMLQDVVRTEAYERALEQVVRPGSKVMDFGCGTGVMSIFASRAGAAEVYAVDRSLFIQVARNIARRNDIGNIYFYHDDHESLELDTEVELIVSEWMGHFLFYEAMLAPLLAVRDRFLAPGGLMVPGKVSLYAGLVCDEYFHEDLSYFRQRPYDIDFTDIAEVPLHQIEAENLLPHQILASTVPLGTLDLHTLEAPPLELVGRVVPSREANIYALCGWFEAHLTPSVRLGTGPADPPTHWCQILFPLTEPFAVSPSREVTVRISPPQETGTGDLGWSWSIADDEQSIQITDLDHPRRLDPELPRGLLP
ncbi:MAG: 50S ribosomal protein L11 methyltransferase [bacterium]